MRVLVTGSAGFIGSHLCDALVASRHRVVGTFRGDANRIEHLKDRPNFSGVECDLSNPRLTEHVVRKSSPEVIFHLAAATPNSRHHSSYQFLLCNSLATGNVLEAAARAKVRLVVYSSSYSVYGPVVGRNPVRESHPLCPGDVYSLTKLQGEELCKLYGERGDFGAIVLRLSGVFGPRRLNGAVYNFVANALKGARSRVEYDLSWDIVYVKDVVRACVASMRLSPTLEQINIGGGCAVNMRSLVELVYREAGMKPNYKLRSTKRRTFSYLDIGKARQTLNYEPTTLSNALAECVTWARNP